MYHKECGDESGWKTKHKAKYTFHIQRQNSKLAELTYGSTNNLCSFTIETSSL